MGKEYTFEEIMNCKEPEKLLQTDKLRESNRILRTCQPEDEDVYDMIRRGTLLHGGSVLHETLADADEDRYKLEHMDMMRKWSVSYYGTEHEMFRSIYYPFYEDKEFCVNCVDHSVNNGWGAFYNDYAHICTKYGSRISQYGNIVNYVKKKGSECAAVGIPTFTVMLHLCMECTGYKMDDEGPILYLRDFLTSVVTIPVDYLDETTAAALVGRMLALEVIVNMNGLVEVIWLRRLTFTKDGWVNCIGDGATPVDANVLFYSNPLLCRDYDAEYGMRFTDNKAFTYMIGRRLIHGEFNDRIYMDADNSKCNFLSPRFIKSEEE